MSNYPEELKELVDYFESLEDRSQRIEMLSSLAERFEPVPTSIAEPPYPESHRVEACESQVYLWAREHEEKGLQFYFAVENPQGIAAMATVVLLKDMLSGVPVEQILEIEPEIVLHLFGGELSTRKRAGLMQIVERIKSAAASYLQTGTVQ
jgi:sulfur transfer protein SufE